MKNRMYAILALVFLASGVLLSSEVYAGGRHHGHWRGHGHGHGHHHYGGRFSIGLGLVLPLYAYGYPYYYGYPYSYVPRPVYTVPAQIPPAADTSDQRAYSSSREEAAYCREYTKTIVVDGRDEVSYGTACLQDDGKWRIMN